MTDSLTKISWLEELYALSQTAASATVLEDALNAMLIHIAKGFSASSGTLALMHDSAAELEIAAGTDLPRDAIGQRIPIGHGVIGRVAFSGEPVLINGQLAPSQTSRPSGPSARRAPSSSMCWPLNLQGRTIGVLSMNRFEADQPFDHRDLQRGAIMANMLALVIENLRMHREQQLRIRSLCELNERLAALNRQLADAQAQLLQREKMASIGQLAAGIAHEINNPLGFISSNLRSLSEYVGRLTSTVSTLSAGRSEPDESLEEMLADIPALLGETKDGLERVKKIVQDLRDFSNVDSTQEHDEVNLNDAVRSAVNMCAAGFKGKPSFDLDLADLPMLRCNSGQINQALLAILQNAVQACAPAQTIYVRSRFVAGEVVLEIEDQGCGIAPENISRIFDPFFTTKPVGQGTGLGLSVAYSAIQKHHGIIDVDSTLGRGACFRIRLPVLPMRG